MNRAMRTIGIVIFEMLLASAAAAGDAVRTDAGFVEGTVSTDGKVTIFKGIPYAPPPVGDLRWKEPQQVTPWEGVRPATAFGPHCIQGKVFTGVTLPEAEMSEDCLYLNVWTPAAHPASGLPVMVWIHGGGFMAGSAAEPTQNGEFLARRGVVVVSMNYRLGIFGFFSHPELTKESGHHASGNYGLMDQAAALRWVKRNIRAFGGDPENVTVAGESAGASSVCALMTSPLSKTLIQKVIGESGSLFGIGWSVQPRAIAEADGAAFAEEIHVATVAELRALPARRLMDSLMRHDPHRFLPSIDGYVLRASPEEIFAKGEQAHVPMLSGWNRDEGNYRYFFGKSEPTRENLESLVGERFGDQTQDVLKLLQRNTDEEVKASAGWLDLVDFVAYGGWKWIELHRRTGDAPVFRYQFNQEPPAESGPSGATHAAEVAYVFGTLDALPFPWTPTDRAVSEMMGIYWTNFTKRGNPNGKDQAEWPQYRPEDGFQVMHMETQPLSRRDEQREVYIELDTMSRAMLQRVQ
jgi:para-nitrobenzyl esterase